jgi:hypothetical protein
LGLAYTWYCYVQDLDDSAAKFLRIGVGLLRSAVRRACQGLEESPDQLPSAIARATFVGGLTGIKLPMTTELAFTLFMRPVRLRKLAVLLACAFLFKPNRLTAEQIPVRHKEGVMHGFLALRTLEGNKLADGEMIQVTEGDTVTDDLIFRFRDGSIYEEKTLFTQKGRFRLLSDHLVEKGPSFKQSRETLIDTSTEQVTIHYKDHDGKEKALTQKLNLPPDLANGLMFTLVKDIEPSAPQTTVSMLATTPKARLVKLAILPEAEKPVSSGINEHKAEVYDVKVQIGGLSGLLARLTQKQPPDSHVWVLGGDAPAVVKSEGPLYEGGPMWRIEQAKPDVLP